MEQRKPEETALLIGMLLLGSGYEKILLELAAIEEKDFVDPDGAIAATDMVLGHMSRFERAAWTLASKIEESFVVEIRKLQQGICLTCSACGNPSNDSAPCRDLRARMELVEPLRNAMWESIRKRYPAAPVTIGVREGFTAVGRKSEEPRRSSLDIEIIAMSGSSRSASLMEMLFGWRTRRG